MKRVTIAAALVFSAAIGAAGFLAMPTLAQSNTEANTAAPSRIANGASFGQWLVRCDALAVGETVCYLSQKIVRTQDQAGVAELLAFWNPDFTISYVIARVPNGVFLPSGFAMKDQASEERHDFVWQNCTPALCEALAEMPIAKIEALEAAETVIAGYKPNRNAQDMLFQVKFAGASQGLTALKAANAARAEKEKSSQ
ncbi:MAG: invasion protein IalB [Halocynthiibacter sp.]|jgi:invasion protein IalB